MVSLLTDSQRNDLHRAIIGYLESHSGSLESGASAIHQLASNLAVDLPAADDDKKALERKWAAVVRLQRKLLDLEQQNAALQAELKEARESQPVVSASTSIANWLPRWPPRHTLEGHRGRVTSVAFHPSWSLVASGSEDGAIKLWDPEQGELEKTLRAHTRAVHSLTFSPLSKLLVSCSADLSIRVWDPAKEFANTLTMVGHDHTVSAVTVIVDPNTNKEYVASASRDKTIRIWELATGFVVRVLRSHSDWVRALDCTHASAAGPAAPSNTAGPISSMDGVSQYLVSAGSDRTVRLTQLFSPLAGLEGTSTAYEGHTHVIECCAVAPEASLKFMAKHFACQPTDVVFASGGRDSTILVWVSAQTEGPVLKLRGHDNWVQGLAFHPNGRFLVSVSDDKTLRIWDLATAKLAKTVPAHDHFVTSIAWHNKTIATGSVDQTVRIW